MSAYERVADDLRASIERGELRPGETVPPELMVTIALGDRHTLVYELDTT